MSKFWRNFFRWFLVGEELDNGNVDAAKDWINEMEEEDDDYNDEDDTEGY